jgi:hypothetical protein
MGIIEIKCRFNGSILFSAEADSLKAAVEIAVKSGANLSGASLDRASLDGASLNGASLDKASLDRASLNGASLNRASLYRASLDGALLYGASLDGASLNRASLNGASLDRASLSGASLNGASLNMASLNGASLDRASLYGALLDDSSKTSGARPVFQIGPIGSRSSYLIAFVTKQGIRIRAGCWFGTLEAFAERMAEVHKDTVHGREYAAAIEMIRKHAELWPADRKGKAK